MSTPTGHQPIERQSTTQFSRLSRHQDQLTLIEMSQRLVAACPDMREMARTIAQEILSRHGNSNIEPDSVYWHRFHTALSSGRSFTGWQHVDPSYESMTLPQLVMHRFNPNDQDNADTLQMLGGFYIAGPHAETFDERNEVRMLPAEALNEFWVIDFKSRYHDQLQAYWQDHSDDFRTLSKAVFLGKALEDHTAGWLTKNDLEMLFKAAGVDIAAPLTVQMLQASFISAGEASFHTFDVVGYEASDILRIVHESGRQILYTPGEVQAFHAFETATDLHWWLLSQNNRAERRARFMGHFPLSAHGQANDNAGLLRSLDLLYSTWGTAHPSVINQNTRKLTVDPFTWLRDSTRTRMLADAEISLRSNAELRKQMWLGYLKDFARISGALAAIDWPIALAAVGAGLADMSLNIDQAVNGHTTAERKAGVIGAVSAGVEALFNGLFLLEAGAAEAEEAGSSGEMIDESAAPAEPEPVALIADLSVLEPGPVYPVESARLLAPFETNMILDAWEPIAEEGRMKGIYLAENGETFIEIDEFAYAVRYINEIKSWVIIDPENPYSFYRNMPVRLNAFGEWQPIARPGLQGGGKIFGKLGWGRSATATLQTPEFTSPYEIPEALRPEVKNGALYGGKDVDESYGLPDLNARDPYDQFKRIRRQLCADTQMFYRQPELPPRPQIPAIEPAAPIKTTMKNLFERTQGIVIGESHASIGSKKFLIENMPLLAKLKVKTLYMEHLFSDFHQSDLTTFARTGEMPEELAEYVKDLDKGHHTDPTGRFNFMTLLKAANENHIRIRPIDCMASYRLQGLHERNLRVKVMNFFAKTIIDADQAATGGKKWIALVGNAHANTYADIAGVSELQGAIGLRVEDVALTETIRIDTDPGQEMTDDFGRPQGIVKSDLRLQMPSTSPTPPPTPAAAPADFGQILRRPGMFLVDDRAAHQVIIHRSNDGTLVSTPIKSDGNRIYIERPRWQMISGRRFENINDLTTALVLMGMIRKP